MSRSVTLGGQVFPLSAAPVALGAPVALAGDGVRVVYLAPSLERWPRDDAKHFAEQVRGQGMHADLLVSSADYAPIVEAWAGQAGWHPLRFDKTMVTSLGLWIEKVSLPARAMAIVDANNRLRYAETAPRLEDEVAFDDALLALKTLR